MPTTTARILQSHGLNANKSAILARELGLTDDTEQPVIGSTVGGAKYLGTEDFLEVVTAAPAAVPLLRRSTVSIMCDLATAGASIALDIRNGAQVAGYRCFVFSTGPDTVQTIVQYATGILEYIPAGCSQEFVWSGAAWMKTSISWGEKHIINQFLQYENIQSVNCKNPLISRAVDIDLAPANWPVDVPILRAIKTSILGVTDHATTMYAASIVQFPNTTEANALLKLIQEDALVRGFLNGNQAATFAADYTTATTQRCLNVNGVDYPITLVDLVNRRATITGTPSAGTSIFYPYRKAGSASARLLKMAGFVGVVAGDYDNEVVGGFCKMDRGQGHAIKMYRDDSSSGAAALNGNRFANGEFNARVPDTGAFFDLIADGVNGTPRIGKTTNPRTAGLYSYLWGAVYSA